MTTAVNGERTLAERAADLLADAIISGRMAPGARLHVGNISRELGIGATPIREALARLTSRGLVVITGQKGFRAAATSTEDLVDIVRLRIQIEIEGLRLSMMRGNAAWEADILHALHLMTRQAEVSDTSVIEADSLHKEFHTALIAGCGSARMMELSSILYDQGYRYRRLMLSAIPDSEQIADNHRELAEAAIARQTRALDLLRGQLIKPLELIYPQALETL